MKAHSNYLERPNKRFLKARIPSHRHCPEVQVNSGLQKQIVFNQFDCGFNIMYRPCGYCLYSGPTASTVCHFHSASHWVQFSWAKASFASGHIPLVSFAVFLIHSALELPRCSFWTLSSLSFFFFNRCYFSGFKRRPCASDVHIFLFNLHFSCPSNCISKYFLEVCPLGVSQVPQIKTEFQVLCCTLSLPPSFSSLAHDLLPEMQTRNLEGILNILFHPPYPPLIWFITQTCVVLLQIKTRI